MPAKKSADEVWVRCALPRTVHEELTIQAVRRRVPLQDLVREVLSAQVPATPPPAFPIPRSEIERVAMSRPMPRNRLKQPPEAQ